MRNDVPVWLSHSSLGCSHKGDRWAVRKMGLVTVCPREKEEDVYLPLSSAHTHTCIFSNCGGEALFCLPCLEKEGERVTHRRGGLFRVKMIF